MFYNGTFSFYNGSVMLPLLIDDEMIYQTYDNISCMLLSKCSCDWSVPHNAISESKREQPQV